MANYNEENSVMDQERTDTGDSFMMSVFECDDGPYFDIDLTLPSNRNDSPLEASTESEKFEFIASVSCTDESNITEYVGKFSPADDLFYKGQLLPLHQHLRLEMVKNLSSTKELDDNTEGSETCSSSSWDSNQTYCGSDEYRCRFTETEEQSHFDEFRCRSAETEQTHFDSMVEPATKMNVEVPKSGFSNFSTSLDDSDKSLPLPPPIAKPKVGIDDIDYSLSLAPPTAKPKFDYCPRLPPPGAKPLSFILKFQCMKAVPLHLLTKDYSVRENPNYSFQNNRTSTSAKHAMQKYARQVKRRICSQIHDAAHAGDQQLKVGERCLWPSITNESRRQTHGNFRHSGAESCLTSTKSSPNISSEDIQSAIDYCKHSNGVIGKTKVLI